MGLPYGEDGVENVGEGLEEAWVLRSSELAGLRRDATEIIAVNN